MKDLFLTMVKIPSPSGGEQQIRKFIQIFFDRISISSTVDTAGNLVAQIPGKGSKILLVAHMDTVQKPTDVIIPSFNQGVFSSNGETILGADNKSGVAILLSTAKEFAQKKNRPTLYFAFTTHEESGQMGSSILDVNQLNPDFILNVDGNKPPGFIDTQGLGQVVFELVVTGKSAHAAISPKLGVHAIKLAAQLVNKLKMGKFSDGSTLNIGQIIGGDSTNTIPDKVILKGEVRAFSQYKLKKMISKISQLPHTKIKILPNDGVPVWEPSHNQILLNACQTAAKEIGLKFNINFMQGSSDANYLATHKIPVININRGGKFPHSFSETISLSDMVITQKYIQTIIKCLQH